MPIPKSPSDASLEPETTRIRAVYAGRAGRRSRSTAVEDAYRRLNDERRVATRSLVERLFAGEPRPRLLDVGCGGGEDLEGWLRAGWPASRLAGVDLVADRVAAARERLPATDIRLNDGPELPWASNTFEIATAVTVLSSIRDTPTRVRLLGEMRRVVRPGGVVIVYDFFVRNPRNPDVVPITGGWLASAIGPPTGWLRLSPFLYAVAAGARVHPLLADLAMLISPRTHRLTYWRIGDPNASSR
jgi:ubiquinone/menaquinone biosynthesis C-methylase UbiE